MGSLLLAPHGLLPARSGLPLRILHLARALGQELDLEVAALAPPPPPIVDEPFRLVHVEGDWSQIRPFFRASWQPWPVAQIRSRAMAHHVSSGQWDVIQAHTLPMAPFVPATSIFVYDAHDMMTAVTTTIARVDSRAGMGPLWRFETFKNRRFERRVAARAAAISVPSAREAELFERLGARRVLVVPNGVDLESMPYATRTRGAEIVFVGYFRWRPNVEAALELCDQILPRVRATVPSATLTLVGADAPRALSERARPHVRFTGGVEAVTPHLRRSRVSVLPIRSGGGTRMKVLEALACGVPVVATSFAVDGLGVRHGVHAMIADTAGDLAELAVRLIGDDDLARSLADAGRRLVERHYEWKVIARPLVGLHQELAERGRRLRR